jgi:hypothetical protein
MSDKDSEKRFIEDFMEVNKGVPATGNRIIVDRETGVHYLFSWSGYAGGITPLLDKDGKPVIKSNNK